MAQYSAAYCSVVIVVISAIVSGLSCMSVLQLDNDVCCLVCIKQLVLQTVEVLMGNLEGVAPYQPTRVFWGRSKPLRAHWVRVSPLSAN